MPKAVLVDLRRCTGCRGCQVACHQWNERPAEETEFWGTYQNPPDNTANTWCLVRFRDTDKGFFFTTWRCMHCLEPACVSVCPTQALHKTEEGPVLYDETRCIGCQYCHAACPFDIPRFDWEEDRVIRKCTFCADRLEMGIEPACVKTCPTDTLTLGERDEVVAKARAEAEKGAYVYGLEEAGGTSWIYLSSVPFDELGFPKVEKTAYPSHSLAILGSQLGTIVVGGAALGLYSLYLRKKDREGERR